MTPKTFKEALVWFAPTTVVWFILAAEGSLWWLVVPPILVGLLWLQMRNFSWWGLAVLPILAAVLWFRL